MTLLELCSAQNPGQRGLLWVPLPVWCWLLHHSGHAATALPACPAPCHVLYMFLAYKSCETIAYGIGRSHTWKESSPVPVCWNRLQLLPCLGSVSSQPTEHPPVPGGLKGVL